MRSNEYGMCCGKKEAEDCIRSYNEAEDSYNSGFRDGMGIVLVVLIFVVVIIGVVLLVAATNS